MDGQQPRSSALWVLGGIGLLGLVAYLAMRSNQGNTLQPTAPATQAPPPTQAPSSTTDTSGNGVATHSMAFDSTALQNPLTSIPTGEFGGSMQAPGMFVETPSGTTIPFTPGIDYALGSIIHYADGSVQIL